MHTVYSKAGVNYRSKTFPLETHGGAPMPYAMFFKGGYAIHGSDYVPSFNASHGCIRVLPADAEWLSRNFITNGTTVIVYPYAT
jgi:lipoprotein-anchoring transpeptidase ErfK/SrfK